MTNPADGDLHFTKGEKQILVALVSAADKQALAESMNKSRRTITDHVRGIKKTLGIRVERNVAGSHGAGTAVGAPVVGTARAAQGAAAPAGPVAGAGPARGVAPRGPRRANVVAYDGDDITIDMTDGTAVDANNPLPAKRRKQTASYVYTDANGSAIEVDKHDKTDDEYRN